MRYVWRVISAVPIGCKIKAETTNALCVSVRNFVCELFYKIQGNRSLVCERPS